MCEFKKGDIVVHLWAASHLCIFQECIEGTDDTSVVVNFANKNQFYTVSTSLLQRVNTIAVRQAMLINMFLNYV